MKLPEITQQPVGEYALGNIPQPNYKRTADVGVAALMDVARAADDAYNRKLVGDLDEATGEAAQEITDLRTTLVNENTLDADEVGDGIEYEFFVSAPDGQGGRVEFDRPRVYTHEVAEEMWEQRTAEIIDNYASKITDTKARAKFVEEMMTRYVVPGGSAVMGANIIRGRAYGQARAEKAVEDVLASDAPTEARESNAREIIARQGLLGADPLWVQNQLSAIGPMVDQVNIQNAVIGAASVDELDQIEEDMWSGGTRLSPEQMRTQSQQITKKRSQMQTERIRNQQENAEGMLVAYNDPAVRFGAEDVRRALTADEINWQQAWTFLNAMDSGSSTKASDPFTLSRMRGAIVSMQYTGANARVSDRADLLRAQIAMGTMGLNPDGSRSVAGAWISGEDAFKLMKDIDTAEDMALENNEYDNALRDAMAWTRVKLDLNGQIVQGLGGSQNTVDAAIAMKRALDDYMDQFGADAKPVEWVQKNKSIYDPNLFARGINARFVAEVPEALQFVTQNADRTVDFNESQQVAFIGWFNENMGAMAEEERARVWTLFKAYYRGEGMAPDGGRLMLESDDPLYRQFEAMMTPDVDQE